MRSLAGIKNAVPLKLYNFFNAPAVISKAPCVSLERARLRSISGSAAAGDGSELPDRYTFRVLAEIEHARGDNPASQAAQGEAGTADARNPD